MSSSDRLHKKAIYGPLCQQTLEYAPSQKQLRPYQTLVLAVDKHEKFGYGTRMEQCQLVPVIINLITPEELQELAEGAKLREVRPRIAARILREAYDHFDWAQYKQGGVLPFSTVGLPVRLPVPACLCVSARRQARQTGGTQTGLLIGLQSATTVGKAVALFYEENPDVVMISFITGLSLSVVEEYIEIRQEMQRQAAEQTQEP